MSADDFFTWSHAAAAVVGGGVAYAWSLVKEFLKREQKATNLARDALVDLALTIRGAEKVFSSRLEEAASDLTLAGGVSILRNRFNADSYLFATTLAESKFLGVFDGDELNQSLLLFFDHYRRYQLFSKLRRETFFWLLDEKSWDAEPAAERLVHFNSCTAGMRRHVLGMLRHGHRAAREFYRRGEEHVTLRRDFGATKRYLENEFDWTKETLDARCEYYGRPRVDALFSDAPTKNEDAPDGHTHLPPGVTPVGAVAAPGPGEPARPSPPAKEKG